MTTTLEKEPQLYRNALRDVRQDLQFAQSFSAKSRLLSLGFGDIAELEQAAQREEAKARPQSLSDAERSLAKAQSLVEQEEARLAAEKSKFAQIESLRVELHQTKEFVSRIPTLDNLRSQIAATEDALAKELFDDCSAVACHYRSGRIGNLVASLNKLDAEVRVNRQVVAIGAEKIATIQAALDELLKKR